MNLFQIGFWDKPNRKFSIDAPTRGFLFLFDANFIIYSGKTDAGKESQRRSMDFRGTGKR